MRWIAESETPQPLVAGSTAIASISIKKVGVREPRDVEHRHGRRLGRSRKLLLERLHRGQELLSLHDVDRPFDDSFGARTRRVEHRVDVARDLRRLGRDVAGADDLAVRVDGVLSADVQRAVRAVDADRLRERRVAVHSGGIQTVDLYHVVLRLRGRARDLDAGQEARQGPHPVSGVTSHEPQNRPSLRQRQGVAAMQPPALPTWNFGDRSYPCPIALTLDRLAGKWKTNILWHIHDGTTRFNALCRALPYVNRGAMLRQLRSLEQDGLVMRRESFDKQVRQVDYLLTERTEALVPVIVALAEWGNRFGLKHESDSAP